MLSLFKCCELVFGDVPTLGSNVGDDVPRVCGLLVDTMSFVVVEVKGYGFFPLGHKFLILVFLDPVVVTYDDVQKTCVPGFRLYSTEARTYRRPTDPESDLRRGACTVRVWSRVA